ncbi:hypothetical protein ACS0TY_011411 [Phlomoides rotata]
MLSDIDIGFYSPGLSVFKTGFKTSILIRFALPLLGCGSDYLTFPWSTGSRPSWRRWFLPLARWLNLMIALCIDIWDTMLECWWR